MSHKRTKIETEALHNEIIKLRTAGLSHGEIMRRLDLKEGNYLKHYGKITRTFLGEIRAKNEQSVAESIKLAEIRLSQIYEKAVDAPLNDDKTTHIAKIKAGELGLNVIMNLLKIQYDGNKLFRVLAAGLNTTDPNPKKLPTLAV